MRDRGSRPDIVFVLADDMGYGDVEVLNPLSKIPTPHMNELARQGLSFTDAHASSAVCTPSRYGILTGSYCWRTRLTSGVFGGYEPPLIDPSRLTMAAMLRGAGYRTVAVGKWHLGLGYCAVAGAEVDFQRPFPWPAATRELEALIDFEQPLTGGPTTLGFDHFFGTSGCPTCQPPYGWIENDRFIDPPSVYEETFPYTGRPGMRSVDWRHEDADPIIVQRAVRAIVESDPDRPLFLYVGLDAPHEPCTEGVTPQVARGKSGAGPRGDLVWMVDHAVGEIMRALDQSARAQDTLLVVSSDNGALAGDRVLNDDGVEVYRTYDHLSNGNWRGYKAHIWEGGHREPLIVRWPGRIAPGSSSDALVCLTDLFATFANLAGEVVPDDAAQDSFDITNVLLGSEISPRRTMIHHSQKGVFAVREGRWKAIFGSLGSGGWPPPRGDGPEVGSEGQLYDLDVDPIESDNLWRDRPDVVSRLEQILREAQESGRTAPTRG